MLAPALDEQVAATIVEPEKLGASITRKGEAMSVEVKKSAAQRAAEKAAQPVKEGQRAAPRRDFYHCPNKLKELRDKLGLSLVDVEKDTGVGRQTVSSAEEGGDISISRALLLAKYFECSVNDIWTGEVSQKAPDSAGQNPAA